MQKSEAIIKKLVKESRDLNVKFKRLDKFLGKDTLKSGLSDDLLDLLMRQHRVFVVT